MHASLSFLHWPAEDWLSTAPAEYHAQLSLSAWHKWRQLFPQHTATVMGTSPGTLSQGSANGSWQDSRSSECRSSPSRFLPSSEAPVASSGTHHFSYLQRGITLSDFLGRLEPLWRTQTAATHTAFLPESVSDSAPSYYATYREGRWSLLCLWDLRPETLFIC